MKSLRGLKNSARFSAEYRGHKLGKFKTKSWGEKAKPIVAEAKCERCDNYVQVMVAPLPNEIEIGGTAVALNCAGKKQ